MWRSKDVGSNVLYEAIRAVANGDAALTPRITRDLIDRFNKMAAIRRGLSEANDPIQLLSLRERDVFDLIATGLNNAEIATRLFVSEATVKTHITRLLSKLELRDRVQVVIYAYDPGLR